MRCSNLLDGHPCGADIPPSALFCASCGSVVPNSVSSTKPCLQCGNLVTKSQKFCSKCAWKIDQNIFEEVAITCNGEKEDGSTCGTELPKNSKFCPECATPVNNKGKSKEPNVSTGPPTGHGDESLKNVPTGHGDESFKNVSTSQVDESMKNVPTGHDDESIKNVPTGHGGESLKNVPAGHGDESLKNVPTSQVDDSMKNVPTGHGDESMKNVPTSQVNESMKNVPTGHGDEFLKNVPTGHGDQSLKNVPTGHGDESIKNVPTGHGDESIKNDKQGTSKSQRKRQSLNTLIDVCFHAVISPTILNNTQEDQVAVVLENNSGGLDNKKHRLKLEKCLEDGYFVGSVTVSILKHLVFNSAILEYKYCVIHGDSVNKITWEYFYAGHVTKKGFKRELSIPTKYSLKGIYHCYDGVVREDPRLGKDKKLWKKIKDYFFGEDQFCEILLKDANISMIAFQPVWQLTSMRSDGINGEELITQISLIEDGMRKVYLENAMLWYRSEKEFANAFAKSLLPYIKQRIDFLDKTNRYQLDEEAKILHLTTAVTVTHLVNKYGLELEHMDKRLLCEALLPMPDFEKKISPDVDHLKKYLPIQYRKVADSILEFSRSIARCTTDPSWMFCVPIIHFLFDKCKPFEDASSKVNHNEKTPEWWGIVEYRNDIDRFKEKAKWKRSADDIVKRLTPYFKMDYLLPRTLMASLKMELLHDIVIANTISPDITLASTLFYIKQGGNQGLIIKVLEHVAREGLSKNENVSVAGMKDAWRFLKIAADLLEESLKYSVRIRGTLLPALKVFLRALDSFDKIQEKLGLAINELNQLNMTKDGHLDIFEDFKGRIVDNWLLNEPFNGGLSYLKLWNAALKNEIPGGKIKDMYTKYLGDRLETSLQKMDLNEEKLVMIYCENAEDFEGIIQEILSKVALKVINKGGYLNWKSLDGKGILILGTFLSNVFERCWDMNKLTNPHEVLNYAVTRGSFPTYMEMLYNNTNTLSEDCQDLLKRFVEIIHNCIKALLQGSILITDLIKLSNNREIFQKTIIAMKCENIEIIMKILPIRKMEFEAFEKAYQIVQNFTYVSIHCKADTSVLENKLRAYNATDMVCLNQLVKIMPLEDLKDIELTLYKPTVTVFELCVEELEILPKILELCKGVFFMKIWEKKGIEAEKQNGKQIQVTEIFEKVWKPAFEQWTNLSKGLRMGNMLFSEFEKWFKMSSRDETELRAEFLLLDNEGNTKWVDERLDQIKKYSDLKSCAYGAQAIMKVVNTFELKGDFSQIQEIVKLTKGADTCMNKLDHSLLKTSSVLGKITKQRADCLMAFIDCKPLVDWLKESMPAGLKELKVFVDLASISAGEGDMEIAKVNCLHSATTGYAPLIFNMDKTCDTNIFLERCKEVWKELASNPQLPKKLLDTCRHLEWLNSVKKSYGSVEITSLSQAQAINEKGIYQVGYLKKTTFLKSPVLTDVLELRVPGEDGNIAQRNQYKYEQLHDLQSRLMLVAGKAEKGKDDVDRFMLILDSVVRLGNIYTILVTEGCVLFSQLHVKFYCDKSRKVCAAIYFGYGKDRRTLKGRIDETNKDVSYIIPKMANFLEQCHDKWLDFIDEKREKYYSLNFFTIDQMVILQQELVKIGSGQEPSALIYPLLSAIKQGCTKEDLVKAMSVAKSDVERLDMDRQKEMEKKDSVKDEMIVKEEPDDLKTSKFLEVMTKYGYSLALAKEALQHFDPDDIDRGLEWCMDNVDEFKPIEEDQHGIIQSDIPVEEVIFTRWTEQKQSLISIAGTLVDKLECRTGENSVEKLIKAMEELWETFLTSISSSVSDYLSIEHLGMILNRLAEQETFIVERTFLPCFIAGKPNLIICPQSEIYNTVLTVYSHEDDKPLPQSDEVLLCTPHTTLDMLEIFWRRALFADNNKVHCLVNADLLDYDISDKGEKSLERNMKNAEAKGRSYRLIVICSSENEYKSRIVAALDKYHRSQLHIDVTNIRKYLLTKIKVVESFTGIKPGAAVDFEKCSVRVVKSWRAGVGKTLYKKRMVDKLLKSVPNIFRTKPADVTIPLHEKTINVDNIMDIFLEEILLPQSHEPRLFHIDISHEVQDGVDALLFQLLILGCLGHSSGHVWRRSVLDYYIIESMPLLARDSDTQGGKLKCLHHCLDILPHVMCRSPQESLAILSDVEKPPDYTDHDRLFDPIEFKSTKFQRPFQYLKRLDTNSKLSDVNPDNPEGDRKQCLDILLKHCGIRDPSWSELHHFVNFFNKQLQDFEASDFCGLNEKAKKGEEKEYLPGFPKFVLRFLIQMSRDFSTRSLVVSEESPMQMLKRQASKEKEKTEDDTVIQLYQMRRTWETSPHPYLFFNPDHNTMTFFGFNIDRKTGNLIDLQSKNVLEKRVMDSKLFDLLVQNKVELAENFDNLPRNEKIKKLCNVMGVDMAHDPDETYELTTDNVKKILAIYMRFRCEIPVIIMGETGCGKTRLIKFMCALQQPLKVTVENMILMKVHGGTRTSDIIRMVEKAEEMASKNAADYPNMDTVLFFDEANTTEAIGVIKEIMCDKSLGGKPIKLHKRLKIVAACNPYRKHSEELIKRLEQAGLGYHVRADKTSDKLGRVPMRRLVYRVQPLPQSMLPLVWDFGQLNTEVEEMYIRQMVLRYIKNQHLPAIQGLDTTISKILTISQDFMREQKDECSFVSLRDVERVLQVMSWFYSQSEDEHLLFCRMRDELSDDSEEKIVNHQQKIDDVTRSLVLALGVCYHACLKNRKQYRERVAKYFTQPLMLPGGADQIENEITKCQSVFLDSVNLAPNIAKNQALKENVFMMIVCIELRIPMFLVGKPGSSKSLAKMIVADAMQGNAAENKLFKNYKEVHMVSFQCSPLSVPEGIVGTFRLCAAYQKDKDLDRFVSTVVLDEIGLAEDSPRMPLKTLHPLLEDGCPDDEEPEKYKKVAFIGISNWAIDPAKMNRGILVQREVPDVTELIESAEGICSTSERVLTIIEPMIQPMAESYLDLFTEASTEMREFFGLRDFYSLLKMLYGFVSSSKRKPTWLQLKHSILRNFGGLENVNPVEVFYKKLSHMVDQNEKHKDDPDCTSAGMIQACLTGDNKSESESRYLLLLTENYGALTILQQKIFTMENVVVIFGSSFPSDQEYTQVCRNINRIKVCMETGSTVILLNLENLYESLYDALNQYYVYFGGVRYVDLGLGSHRVKCRVHSKFRLIVVAEKQIVYNNFPIPLINRLEKHFLSLNTMLTQAQLELAEKLQTWAQPFCEVKVPAYLRQKKDTKKKGDAFMGYHDDTCAAIILHVCQKFECNDQNILQLEQEILKDAQLILLWCATPAAVVQGVSEEIFNTYFHIQHHESLADYFCYKIVDDQCHNIHSQITTNSKLLSTADIDVLCRCIPIQRQNVTLLTLQSFDTEQQFCRQIKSFFDQSNTSDMLLIVQCDCGDQNADLIACARYTVQGELQQVRQDRTADIHVVFLIQLPGIAGGCFSGFQCGLWHSVHIDDIHPAPEYMPSVADMHGKSVGALLAFSAERPGGNTEKQDDSKKQFKIESLIKKCVQPALGNVKDSDSDSSRAIERLNIILNCLNNEQGEMTVISGLTKHLTNTLKEKEQTGLQSVIKNWLSTEASKPENTNRPGTFRKCAVQCLESRVIPILAGIIAFIDTNRNLDILSSSSYDEEWKIDIWLQIFNNPDLTKMKYSLMVSPSRQQELQEVAVKTTSVDGNVFSALMPFSWLIFEQIDEVLRKTIETKDYQNTNFDVVIKASQIFNAIPMGRLLAGIEGTHINDILKFYIKDFIHMVHPVQSEAECNIVCECVLVGCKQLIMKEFGRLIPSLLGCHMTYILHDARYKNLSNIINLWPECGQKMVDFQQEHSHSYLISGDEITLDILALHLLVEHLEPSIDALKDTDRRTKWLRQVCDFRPVVERILGHVILDTEKEEFQYGERRQKGVERARFQWTRVVVVKLFIEHVCTTGKEDLGIRQCMTLWGILREGANMKDVKYLEKVEKFLKHCNRGIAKDCFGQPTQCVSCESIIEGAPVSLPCDHVICRKCFTNCVAFKEFECPTCQEKFPVDLDPNKSVKSVKLEMYNDFRSRCNSFFMEVVSQLCFSEGPPPSKKVVEKLLSYITGRSKTGKVERVVSKELTIFADAIDPSPVVRSFLLQQLMQTSGDEIDTHLSAYFTQASDLVKTTGDPQQLVELCLLVLQCKEDSLHQQYTNRYDEIAEATQMLREADQYVTSGIDILKEIDHISRVRFSMTVVAKYMHKFYGTAQKSMHDSEIPRLLEAAAQLCDEGKSRWPRLFFVKQLCRCYGIDSYHTILAKSDASFLRWIRLPELKQEKVNYTGSWEPLVMIYTVKPVYKGHSREPEKWPLSAVALYIQVEECHDRYIVICDEYTELRETVVTTALSENSEKLEQMLQKPAKEWQTRIKVLLALHREITLNNLYGGDPQKFTDKGIAFLNQFIMGHGLVVNKELAGGILNNTIWKLQGNIIHKMDLAQQNIYCLLTHYFILMKEIPGKTTLITPLYRIALDPQNMINSYFPTMPEDDLAEIKEAVLAARKQNPDENPVFYRCPNGHPYLIVDCGRAKVESTCSECGMTIGGKNHKLRADNMLDSGVDRTETGHVLGRATNLGPITAPERKLNRASFSILRLLTHLSMYVGANIKAQAVCQSIKPSIEQGDVGAYLLEHIDLDMTSIQNILGKNKDDVLILIHVLLTQIMNRHTMAVKVEDHNPDVCGLLTTGSRTKWEVEFAQKYIVPVAQDMENILKRCNDQVLKDERLGSDPLLQMLYETDKPQETSEVLTLQEVPAAWRYRALITVNHLRQNIDSTQQKLSVLRLFLKEEHHLRLIRFIPRIIRLQKMLIQKYIRKLDRAEATTLTIQDVKKDMRQERQSEIFESLLKDYKEAWNNVRESLEFYVCQTKGGKVTIDKGYCKLEITDETTISHLLPTHRDAGLCSYALLFFLMKKQNLFLQNYCLQCKRKEDSLPKVHVKDISSAHLISYHPDRDLLPMVLANCNYSFEVGQGTKVEYNFTNLERQLMDRFLFSKSIIHDITEIETITYRSESTNSVVFKSLCDNIKQERLNPAVQSQICGELRKSYPDLCESLDKLDIAISFLKSVGSDPESSLHDFMTDTLKMDKSFSSLKAQQASRCKHTMSMWITMTLERAKFLAKHDKKAFEGISDNFKEPLTEEQRQAIEEILNKLAVEQIDILVELIFECIVLKIDVPQNKDDEDYVDMSDNSLRDTLIGFQDAYPYEGELILDDMLMEAIYQLPSDADNPIRVLTGHSVETWIFINKVLTNKQQQSH